MQESNGSLNLVAKVDRLLLEPEGAGLKAYCTLTLGGLFSCHGFRVVQKKDGTLFVSEPQNRWKDKKTGEYRYSSVFHAVTKEGREVMHNLILDAFSAAAAEETGK